ncbi:MAG TPA: hypothetical protein VHR66_15320 [Gemmataceae bacterium]|jgi:hypothetical protein|nr:hypothetical protein [Gemmataceae bacterium]
MSRNRDRWGEAEDDYGERSNSSRRRMSPALIIILIVGAMFLLIALACGGIMFVGYHQAKQAEQEEIRARQAEQEQIEAERVNADMERIFGDAQANPAPHHRFPQLDEIVPPPPKPGSTAAPEPPPQPKATKFATDDADHPNHWRVLFRSKKPELWNTNTQAGDDFAIPLRSTLEDVKYLRLRRMDTGDAIIIPITRGRISRVDPMGPKVRWNGEGKDEHGGYHLGIAEGPVAKFTEGQGTIGVLMDGWDANPGSGFGHAHHVDNGGQRYSWLGKEIPATVFEIAVTTEELTDKDRALLRK